MSWTFQEFDKKYNRTNFDCGVPALNTYLKNQMSQDVQRKANVPLLAVNPQNDVVGFYTLSASSIEFSNFPDALKCRFPLDGHHLNSTLGHHHG